MGKPRYGCQTYTWQMTYEKYRGRMEHMASVVRRAGMAGIEPEVCMLSAFARDPVRLKDCLAQSGVELGAISLVGDWNRPVESEAERGEADATIATLKAHFPRCALVLGQMAGPDRSNLEERQKNAFSCIAAVGARAREAGLTVAFHPNSAPGSIFRLEADYRRLLAELAQGPVGFAPDAGHIARGGMDAVAVFREGLPLIRHVHFKDMDTQGRWVEMGRGSIDFRGIVSLLEGAGYGGWIMVEDESALAERDPDAAVLYNGRYIAENFGQGTP
jgi:inosose dehydratase